MLDHSHPPAIFEARGLSKAFNGFRAVNGADILLGANTIHAVIGPNGAGKSTLFNLLTKFLRPDAGTILLDGRDVTALAPPALALAGVVRSFQISAIFAALTVRENLQVATLRAEGLQWRMVGSIRHARELGRRVSALAEQFGLADCLDRRAADLPYGRKRILELATTLAQEPRVLLLDEPMAGLGHEDVDRVASLVREASRSRAILLVEHNMRVVAELADTITVLVRGAVLARGTYAEVSGRADVIEAYTGGGGGHG